MTKEEKINACYKFFDELTDKLTGKYEVLKSCNNDISEYLIPIGTLDQVSYYGKPVNSFRFSDHWNWFANINKCSKENEIQCFSVDIPYPRPRSVPGKATDPRFGIQVSYYGKDKKYHVIFGDAYDRKTKSWRWHDGSIDEALAVIGG